MVARSNQPRAARWRWAAIALLLGSALVAPGCGDDDEVTPPGPAAGVGGSGGGGVLPEGAESAWLELHPLDIWAQPLPEGERTVTVTVDNQPVAVGGEPPFIVPLDQAATIRIEVTAYGHEPLAFDAVYAGPVGSGELTITRNGVDPGQGLSAARDIRFVDGAPRLVHSIYTGLQHRWFSAQARPARRGNAIELFTSGEAAWASVSDEIKSATDSVMIGTWWWQSDFELLRPLATHATLTPTDRWQNTMLSHLENTQAHVRVMVGQFWGQDSILSWITTDADLEAYAEAPGDDFEMMGRGNNTAGAFTFAPTAFSFADRVRAAIPDSTAQQFATEDPIATNVPGKEVDLSQWPVSVDTEIASFHQKFAVIDHETAFIGGMNVKATDWDTDQHLVFEPRRMPFDATTEERDEVATKEADSATRPRKDYMIRVEGPAAQDAAEIFKVQWDDLIDIGAVYNENSSTFEVQRNIAPRPGGLHVQVTATLPEPHWEHGIAESWFNAVQQAEDYIFIEDQYFRAPLLNQAIIERMQAVPDLRLIVITKPLAEFGDPGCVWTYKAHQTFRNTFPDRFLMLQLRVFDTVIGLGFDETEARFADLDVHSKMLIVDDQFMSVGSANKNNRGMIYEAELNVAVFDPSWVKNQRKRLLNLILPAGVAAADATASWWLQLQSAAVHNDGVYLAWEAESGDLDLDGAPLPPTYTPEGTIYSLTFGSPTDCLFESVGPDQTGKPITP